MSYKTKEGKFKCENCHGYFIEEDEVLCKNCEEKASKESEE